MKRPFFSALAPAAAIGGMALILGCSGESKSAVSAPTATSSDVTEVAAVTAEPEVPTQPPPAVAAPLPAVAKSTSLSPAAEQLVQLAQAGVGDDVLLAFIERFPGDYKLQVDEILYLHDLGVSTAVISAMMRHDQVAMPTTGEVAGTGSPVSSSSSDHSAETPVSPPAAQPAGLNPLPETIPVSFTAETSQAPVAEPPPAQPTMDNYFYDNLAPYGNWIEDADYGWCWQPTVAVINVGWRPYCDGGRWLWSDCGWYWQSSYSWGCIPFHYGRWCYRPSGWAWVPGRVWGPAWVTWCNSGSYCGWAPLPPGCGYSAVGGLTFGGHAVGVNFSFGLHFNCWTFVPAGRVCNYSPWYYAVPPSQVPAIINKGTIVNNYVRGSGRNGVVNVGPGLTRIAAVSRDEVRTVSLRDANAAPGTPVKADRLDRAGRTLTVFRPALPAQASAPPAQVLAHQQEVRRNSEALVKSEVVSLARAENRDDAAAPLNSGGRITTIPGRVPTTATTSVSLRDEIPGTADGRGSRHLRTSTPGSANAGGAQNYSPPANVESSPAPRGEVRPPSPNGLRPGRGLNSSGTVSPYSQDNSGRGASSSPTRTYPVRTAGQPAYPTYQSQSDNSQAAGVPARTPGSGPASATPARPVIGSSTTSYNPPQRTYAAPQSAPSRSATATPAYSSPPAASRPQPSSSSSSSQRSAKNTP